MKTLTINESNGQQLVLFRNENAYTAKTRAKTLIACPLDGATWLEPKNLLRVRDWINERVRELQFHGHLPDQHLGD